MVSTAVISEVLKGMDFPADKRSCIDYARRRDAPREVIQALERMPDAKFDNMADVFHAVGEEHKKGQMPGPIAK